MTFLQIQCFSRLANNKRMNKTAAEFNISSSSLTKQMQQLEDELSVELFNNTTEGFALTECGKLIYPSMQFISYQYNKMLSDMKQFTEGKENLIRIILPFHHPDIIEAILDFQDEHPSCNFYISENTSEMIQEAIYNSDIDLGFNYIELISKKLSGSYLVNQDKLVAVLSKDHRFAERKQISLSELKDEKFCLFRDDIMMYRYYLTQCTYAGFVPKVDDSDCRLNTILWKVSRNEGVTLFTDSVLKQLDTKGCVIIPLAENIRMRMTMFFPNAYPMEVVKQLTAYILDRFNERKPDNEACENL